MSILTTPATNLDAGHETKGQENSVTRRHLGSLTGFRAIAAFMVFCGHATIPAFATAHKPWTLSSEGAAGVSFFFLLSGFVLAWTHRADDRLRDFYRRRFARIYPCYFVAFCLGVALFGYQNHTLPTHWQLFTSAFLLQSWSHDPAVFFGVNGVAWSLSVEAFFYALFPLCILLLQKLNRVMLLTCAGSFILATVFIPLSIKNPTWTTYLLIFPPYRLLEFVTGITLALLVRRGFGTSLRLNWTIALVVIAYLAAGKLDKWWAVVVPMVIPFAMLIVAAAHNDLRKQTSILSTRAMIVLGQWSYAFYLTHQLLLRYMRTLTIEVDGPGKVAAWFGSLLAAIAIAGLLYTCIERPFEKAIRNTVRTRTIQRMTATKQLALSQRPLGQ